MGVLLTIHKFSHLRSCVNHMNTFFLGGGEMSTKVYGGRGVPTYVYVGGHRFFYIFCFLYLKNISLKIATHSGLFSNSRFITYAFSFFVSQKQCRSIKNNYFEFSVGVCEDIVGRGGGGESVKYQGLSTRGEKDLKRKKKKEDPRGLCTTPLHGCHILLLKIPDFS